MRKLVITLVVLLFLAVVADRVAKYVADSEAATLIQNREHLSAKPTVDFEGFPFLTQVISGDFGKVAVSMPEVSTGGSTHGSLRIRHVDATFYHVRTSDYFRQATVQVATGSATLPFSDLRSLGLSAGYGGTSADGAGLLSVAPLGSSGPRVKVGVSESQGGGISFVGAGGAGGAGGLLGAAGGAVRSLLGQPYVLSGLPAGLSVDSVQVTKQGITLSLSGRHIILHR